MAAASEPQPVALENEARRRENRSGAPAPEPAGGHGGGLIVRNFNAAPTRPPAESTVRFLRSPSFSHSANNGVRADALQRAQQTYGNHFVQRAIASAQKPE